MTREKADPQHFLMTFGQNWQQLEKRKLYRFMKGIYIVFLLGFIITGRKNHNNDAHPIYVEDTSQIIKDIKSKYAEFNLNKKKYHILEKDLMGETTEGGFIAAYRDGMDLREIRATYYKETGKLIEEYYFNENDLIFALVQEYFYNKPIGEQGSKIASIKEDRFYFNKKSMLKWLENKKIKDPKSKEYANEGVIIMNDAGSLRKSLVDCSGSIHKILKQDTVRCKNGSDCPSTGYIINGSRDSCGEVIHVTPKNKNVRLEQ